MSRHSRFIALFTGLLGLSSSAVAQDVWLPGDLGCVADAEVSRAAAAEQLAVCRREATAESATGLTTTRWDEVSTCMAAHGWAGARARDARVWNAACATGADPVALIGYARTQPKQRWVLEGTIAITEPAQARRRSATSLLACQSAARVEDASGMPRLDHGAVARCMKNDGYAQLGPVTWEVLVHRGAHRDGAADTERVSEPMDLTSPTLGHSDR